MKNKMQDVQNRKDNRNLKIDKVGIKRIKYPIVVLDKNNQKQNTIADISMYVDLPEEFKGTHMSRFVEILNKHKNEINYMTLPILLNDMKEKLHAKKAHITASFPYFIEKTAPESKQKSIMDYRCKFIASQNAKTEFILEIKVPVTSVCPCSKELCDDKAAHNQRSIITVQLKFNEMIWIEDLIEIIEAQGSSEVYTLLKRDDEKYVTQKAFENPKFVEDIVRDVALAMEKKKDVLWYKIEVENLESIHNHSAYALIEKE